MGIKGTLGWRLKTRKVSHPMMRVVYDILVNQLVEKAKKPEDFNNQLRAYGKIAGEKLLMDYLIFFIHVKS